MKCYLCPRRCGVDRESGDIGFCSSSDKIKVALIAPHLWEEPPVSGSRGSGAIFFSGCSLRCVFCQNREISRDGVGYYISEDELAEKMLALRDMGVHNINLVTPTHYSDKLARVLEKVKPELGIPVVYNCGGYESVDALRRLDGLIDVYLPDFKYYSNEISEKYSLARDYCQVATEALIEMHRQQNKVVFGDDGLIKSGIIVRHLVLPGNRHDSIAVLEHIADIIPVGDIKISIMRQYTPDFAKDCRYPELHRRVTTFEYDSVAEKALQLGFDGYIQQPGSADKSFTPDFGSKIN